MMRPFSFKNNLILRFLFGTKNHLGTCTEMHKLIQESKKNLKNTCIKSTDNLLSAFDKVWLKVTWIPVLKCPWTMCYKSAVPCSHMLPFIVSFISTTLYIHCVNGPNLSCHPVCMPFCYVLPYWLNFGHASIT